MERDLPEAREGLTAAVAAGLSEIPAADWDALHDGRNPFVTHAFWFGVQDIPGSVHAGGFGLHRWDKSPKPAAAAFRAPQHPPLV